MESISFKAYAKLNLTLDIVGVKSNGYHLLKMVMQSINLHDLVTVTKNSGGINITCNNPRVPTNQKNIVYKCAEQFFSEYKITDCGVNIHIKKNIPCNAGMAGGSADAAATLCALNILCKTNMSDSELCKLGVKLGADIPFCIIGGTLLAEGIGEILSPLPKLANTHIAIAKPRKGVRTQNAFSEYDRRGATVRPNSPAMISALTNGDILAIGQNLCNVLEEISAPCESIVIKNTMLKSGACGSIMTGSGSAVFGLFTNRAQAENCIKNLDAPFRAVCSPVTCGIKKIK